MKLSKTRAAERFIAPLEHRPDVLLDTRTGTVIGDGSPFTAAEYRILRGGHPETAPAWTPTAEEAAALAEAEQALVGAQDMIREAQNAKDQAEIHRERATLARDDHAASIAEGAWRAALAAETEARDLDRERRVALNRLRQRIAEAHREPPIFANMEGTAERARGRLAALGG